MFARLVTAVATGIAVTLSLLFAMHSLITMQSADAVEPRTPYILDFVRVVRNEEVFREEFQKPELEKQPEPPPLPKTSEPTEAIDIVGRGRNPTIPRGPDKSLTTIGMHDGALMTIVRVQPTYPIAAIQRGLEGFVVVEFDVLANGTVGAVSVLESSSSIFERAAIQAAKRFRFKARIVDGEPLASSGVQYRFRFEIDD